VQNTITIKLEDLSVKLSIFFFFYMELVGKEIIIRKRNT